ncbi:MAG: carboxypeptidase regulatory-like domain-containing protein [Planctomycetes bacterium]|nr:carboxypeptidase regulatory-like domain-containing protein [Planctomycetota bacterium]
MGQKLIVPVAAVLLAVSAGVAIWFLMSGDSPRPKPQEGNQQAESNKPDEPGPLQLNPADFDVSRIEADPVASERPPEVFKTPDAAMRLVVSGRVVTEDGVGLADAEVTFTGEQKLRDLHGVGYTDAGGNFTLLAWASRGATNASGERMGRLAAQAQDGRIAVGDSVSVVDSGTATMPDLVVRQGASLSGQVVTDAGMPAPGVQVTARSAGPVEVISLRGRTPTSARRQFVTSVTADETGRYEFKQLPVGGYALQAEGGYFGFNARIAEVDLTAARNEWLDLTLTAEHHVRGVVKDQAGNPVAGAVVRLIADKITPSGTADETATDGTSELRTFRGADRDAPRRFSDAARVQPLSGRRCVTDAAGRFGFSPVVEGEYTLATKLGEEEARLEGVGPDQPDYELQIAIKTSVSGTVRDAETGLPIESYDFRVMRGGDAKVTPFDRVSENGTFEYHPGGLYLAANPSLTDSVVRISAPGYAPEFISAGTLREGDARRDLDVSLKPLCDVSFDISHEGRKLDLEPVALLFDDRLAYEASSDELGLVRIPGAAPATYKVTVVLADGTILKGSLDVPARRNARLELKLS